MTSAEPSDGTADILIVGGGIVGLATARALVLALPGLRVVLLEKEDALATHQTGRNSGVVHSGIYYTPGSLKARYARDGLAFLSTYCRERGIAFEQCGKVIVATEDAELARLDTLQRRAADNGIPVQRLDASGLRAREPHAAGLAALLVPSTAIVDYVDVCAHYRRDAEAGQAEIVTGADVVGVHEDEAGVRVETRSGADHVARLLINCAGLHSDRIARLAGLEPRARILPFRGEYYELTAARRELVSGLIYPVPDPSFPFLGVHLTKDVHGGVHAGPNAVLAFAREGYTLGSANSRDVADIARFPGFWRLARKHWRTGAGEYRRSLLRSAFVQGLQRLVPEVRAEDLVPAPAGVRAQAVLPDGTLVDDFLIEESARCLHVLNAPSPAATASMPIGGELARRALARLR